MARKIETIDERDVDMERLAEIREAEKECQRIDGEVEEARESLKAIKEDRDQAVQHLRNLACEGDDTPLFNKNDDSDE